MKDIVAAIVSLFCMLHCLVPVIAILLGIAFFTHSEVLHIVLLAPILALIALSLPSAFKVHHNKVPLAAAIIGFLTLAASLVSHYIEAIHHLELGFSIVGSGIVMFAHLFNRRLLQKNEETEFATS